MHDSEISFHMYQYILYTSRQPAHRLTDHYLQITIAGSHPDDTEYFHIYILIIAGSYRLMPEAYPSIT